MHERSYRLSAGPSWASGRGSRKVSQLKLPLNNNMRLLQFMMNQVSAAPGSAFPER